MPATLIFRKKEYKVKAGMTIRSAIEKSDILPESVLPTRDGELVPDDELLKEGETIKLIAVISGG